MLFRLVTVCAVLMLLLSAATAGPLARSEKISLELEDAPIATVLGLVAQQNDLNIVVSGDVDGEVSLRLVNVDVATALEAILAPNGYNYYISGDVIVVKPVELAAVGELRSHLVTLKHQNAQTIKTALDSRTSDKGSVIVLDVPDNNGTFTPNQLLITDLPSVVDQLAELADKMDIAQELISIEVKIIESKLDTETKLGLNWPSEITTNLGIATNDEESLDGTESSGGSGLDGFAGSHDLSSGKWTWGTLTVSQLTSVLDLLNQNGNSKLISDPHLTTLENHQAEIRVETIIPIPTVNRFTEGAATSDILTFQDEEVGISLLVTPRISANNKIILDVMPQVEDIIGYSGPPDNRKPITSARSIRTRVTVNNGETVALGGLLKEDEIVREKKFPLLGSIPLLGRLLFTNKQTETATTDLIILITPTIVP